MYERAEDVTTLQLVQDREGGGKRVRNRKERRGEKRDERVW